METFWSMVGYVAHAWLVITLLGVLVITLGCWWAPRWVEFEGEEYSLARRRRYLLQYRRRGSERPSDSIADWEDELQFPVIPPDHTTAVRRAETLVQDLEPRYPDRDLDWRVVDLEYGKPLFHWYRSGPCRS